MVVNTNTGGESKLLGIRSATTVMTFLPTVELSSLTLSRTADASYNAKVSRPHDVLRSVLEQGT